MIVSQHRQTLRLVQQIDHARLSAELGALWVLGDLADHPRREEILFAIRHHDNGWQRIDSVPLCDATSGQPIDFAHMPIEYRLDIWQTGPRRYADSHPYSALLILRHALELHRDSTSEAAEQWRPVREDWAELEAELIEVTGVTPSVLEQDYRWLRRCDQLSLAICALDPTLVDASLFGGLRLELAQPEPLVLDVGIEPFPFAGATSFEVACRLIPARRYTGDADLAATIAGSRWQRAKVRVSELS